MEAIQQALRQVFGVNFIKQADITELRQYHHPNTFCCNTEGELIGIFSSENDYTDITIPADWQALAYLNLSDNKNLQSLTFEGSLPRLRHLDVSDSQLSELTLLMGFDALRWLDVSRNKLGNLNLAGNFPKLTYCDFSSNQLGVLEIPDCPKLQFLYLNDNQLVNLSFSTTLPALEILHLRNNKLENLPENFLALTSLETLYLHGNPLSSIPKEHISEDEEGNSYEGVWDYLQELSKGDVINNRAKLIIVGNGRVGKTSIYRRLADEPFNAQEQYTHGVQLGELNKEKLPDVKTDELQLQVWDFGGQEIFYATHQFFLSDEAVYILAWTDERNVKPHRERDKETLPFDERWRSCEYWLENIRLRAEKSPIVMVQTHSDIIEHKRSNELEWGKKPFEAITTEFSAAEDLNLKYLKKILANRLNSAIPMLGEKFPQTYENVIQEIGKIKDAEPTITKQRFLELCEQGKIDKGREDSLLQYLHKAGVVVYFNENALKDIVFIDPNWLTSQVYKLINNNLRARKGRFDWQYLEHELPAPEYDDEKRKQFVELLKKFELIFENQENGRIVFIAPQYLPDQLEPTEQDLYDIILEDLSLSFVFRFPKFLPDNVMINFLSRYGPFSKKMYWKNGICFTNATKAKCIVEFEEQQKQLNVYSQDTEHCRALQREVCQAFVELSRNANAEISLDGKVFASWQELEKFMELYSQNSELQFFAVNGKTPLKVKDFAQFILEGEYRGINFDQLKKNKPVQANEVRDLITRARLKEALEALLTLVPEANKNEVRQLLDRLEKLERDDRLGTLSYDEASRTRNKITIAALALCEEPAPEPEPVEDASEVVERSTAKGKTKILFLAANPADQSRIQTDLEHRILKNELQLGGQRDKFEFLLPQFAVTVSELLRAMNDKPNIVHFSGHGMTEGIAITTNDNQTQLVPIPALQRLFKSLRGIATIVILNACYSAAQAKVISEFGMYVVGNNLPITDPAAISFSKGFYNGIGEGKSFEDAFNDAMFVVLTENAKASEVIEVWKDGQKLAL